MDKSDTCKHAIRDLQHAVGLRIHALNKATAIRRCYFFSSQELQDTLCVDLTLYLRTTRGPQSQVRYRWLAPEAVSTSNAHVNTA